MKVISVDSSTTSATCAVVENNKLLGEITYNDKKQHSVVLMSQIDVLLKNLNLTIEEINGFVVSKGPGSFTGLRIGMATIKGLAQPLNKPVAAISSLDALAFNMAYTQGIICPIMDALRDNVYTALYSFEGKSLVRLTDYMAIHIDELINILQSKNEKSTTFIGDAVPKFREKLYNNFENTFFAPIHLNVVKASSLGELGIKKLLNGENENIFSLAPIYLKKSQAEREYDKKMEMKSNA
ncbi:tRNA (adenosine(37)-N6)-threonylcarbamoyltransferase complex dimerization subunit type 1 TsaB [Clostridium sediminicola]|uniref:tRNA (adenosine(37)-N6)-threonylcarbamoyltransferase complex dimerization subunit type 1 TsaB n=1 Tax=Clostridium sediminicola TaxID=3114879 RepID=UPI0031F20B9D